MLTTPSFLSVGTDAMDYPVKGLAYLMNNSSLWRTSLCLLCLGIVLSLVSLITLLATALVPQADAFGGGEWWSWCLAIIAVFLEAILITFLLLKFLSSKAQKSAFVQTMKLEGTWKPDMVPPSTLENPCNVSLFIQIVTFPLNLVPVAGTIAYLLINSSLYTWDLIGMYYDAISLDEKLQRTLVLTPATSNPHIRFGCVGMMMELIPVLGQTILPISNAVAAALWASDMERIRIPTTSKV